MLCFYHPVVHSTVTNIFFEEKKHSFILRSSFIIKLAYLIGNKPFCTLWYVLKQVPGLSRRCPNLLGYSYEGQRACLNTSDMG